MRKLLESTKNYFQKWQSAESSRYFPALTGIRAIAAYMVFFLHFNPFKSWGVTSGIFRFFNEWHAGVALFFVLSGFLICLRYYDSFEFSRTWFVRYIQNRVARIYPMYFILTSITFLYLFAINGYFETWLYISHITFVRGFFDDLRFTGIGPGWSLTVEETFYFLAPVIFLLSRRVKLVFHVLFFIFTCILLVFISQKLGLNYLGFFGSYRTTLHYTFFGRCFEFYLGIQLALWFRAYQAGKSTPLSIFANLSAKMPFFTSFGIIWFAICMWIMGFFDPFLSQSLAYLLRVIFNNLILPIGIGFIYWGILTEKTRLRRFLETGIMQLLGKSSYVFYLVHMTVIATFIEEEITGHNLFFTFIALNLVSIFLFKYVEEPLNERIRKIKFLTNKTTVSQLAN